MKGVMANWDIIFMFAGDTKKITTKFSVDSVP
jgi:hypothetical protein